MIEQVAGIYARIILEFLAELYIFYALTMHGFNRSRAFAAKLIAGLAAVAAIAFGLSFFYYFYGSTVVGRIAVYIVLFVVSIIHARICLDEKTKTIILGCSLAYAAQNLTYKLFLVFYCSGEYFGLFENWGQNFELYYRLTYYAFFIVASAAVYFVLIRRQIKRLADSLINYRMMAISIFVLCITVILCSSEDVHFAALSTGGENRFDNYDIFILRQTGNVFSVVCCAAVMVLISKTMVERDLKREVEYLQHAVRQGQRQYEISKDTIDMINIKCHDIKYKVNSLLAGGGVTEEALADLQQSIKIYDTRGATGNKSLDVLLTEKNLYCEQNGITFSCMADGGALGFIEEGDLYCLFGNIIDNALEAVSAVSQRERKVINLVVKTKNDMLVVQQENYFEGELKFEGGLPQTTKSDKNYHGFGTRSIRMIVHKYGGAMTARARDGVFYLSIIFSLDGKKLQNK